VQTVPERAGPAAGEDVSSKVWLYHSHTDEVADTYSGLQGPLVVTRAGGADSALRPDGARCALRHLLVFGRPCANLPSHTRLGHSSVHLPALSARLVRAPAASAWRPFGTAQHSACLHTAAECWPATCT
jgi:hypothetical protein